MPDFSVHVDQDELDRQALTPEPVSAQEEIKHLGHHGAADPRQAARSHSDRAHAGRANTGAGRSYAFRRS